MSGMSTSVLWKSGGFQASHQRRNREDQSWEEAEGSGEETEDFWKPEAPSKREGGSKKFGIRSRVVAAVSWSWNIKEARLFRKIREDSQSCDKSQHTVCWIANTGKIFYESLFNKVGETLIWDEFKSHDFLIAFNWLRKMFEMQTHLLLMTWQTFKNQVCVMG